jgi:serine/threonine protein kinase
VQNGWHANEAEVRRIAIQLLEILVYLHERTPALIHRDIKPQNLIRRADGQVFLVDFGAVSVYSSDRTTVANSNIIAGTFGTVVGTFGYMAPEQFLGQAVPGTDLYGLGATLLFLLTHRCPADLPTDGLKFDVCDRLQISDEFADWLKKMLEPDVADRFSSAKEALAMLQGRQITPHKSRQPLRKKTLVKLGVATVAALAVLNHFKYPILNRLGITSAGIYEAAYWGQVDRMRN